MSEIFPAVERETPSWYDLPDDWMTSASHPSQDEGALF
jgi:hypothetical protein